MEYSKGQSYIVVAAALLLAGCIPSHLRKYQEPVQGEAQSPAQASPGADDATMPPTTDTQEKRTAIMALPEGSYRFNLPDNQVWQNLIAVLMKNYNLTLVNPDLGLVTTEWDSYQLNDTVYRNKVSARLVKTGRGTAELTIFNNVEQLSDAHAGAPVWLPADDLHNEGFRIVKNMAILLKLDPPAEPAGVVARGFLP